MISTPTADKITRRMQIMISTPTADKITREIHLSIKYYIDKYITIKKEGTFIWLCYNNWPVALLTHTMTRLKKHMIFYHIASTLEAVERFGGTLIPKETV